MSIFERSNRRVEAFFTVVSIIRIACRVLAVALCLAAAFPCIVRGEPSVSGFFSSVSSLEVHRLRCESQDAPTSTDTPKPDLSWNLASEQRGQYQSAYQILVASSPQLLSKNKGDIWDSGKVLSDQNIPIPYGGKELVSREKCFWKVRVWDQQGHSSQPGWNLPGYLDGQWQSVALALEELSADDQAFIHRRLLELFN